ncbi:ABC transporter substrate-binding protein [Pseudomonas chlororaphis]|uniref:ABC transporter substrate-binding protein n=1 Tax=Pseudomonas TaxID=286 RepID=UPI0005BEE98D|nr:MULTISPECIES: ABC transporter substrate-binding protein [Pseudomonas]AJO76414.1 amino acid ABC transporter substrate-binding protein [Pseudomonas sp. MRSN 12121]MCB2256037.1 ABC transporter substrate-binding protein [Pseudomonas chlororaphis]
MLNKNNVARLTLLTAGLLCATAGLASTATPGQLKIGMEITYPPFESYDSEKNVVGSDPELAHALARHLNAKAEFVDTKFPSLILGLNAGRYDAIISGMYITPERQTQAMTIAYAKTGAAIMASKDSGLNPQTPEDLCGLKVGLEQGTTWVSQLQKLSSDYCVPNNKGAISVNEYPSAPEVTQALLSKNIQAQVEIAGAAKMIAERTNGRVVVTSQHLIYQQTLGIFVKKGNDATYKALQEAFAESRRNGEYAAILGKYNLEPVTD